MVNDFGILASFTYLASTFEYINQYGQMETHNPEEFFTRLFRNKYDQEPSPAGCPRFGCTNNSGRTQLQFLMILPQKTGFLTLALTTILMQQMEMERASIPNVPLDILAFGETALIYNALLDVVPSAKDVARLTLDPDYEVRPLAERARMIMDMPAFAQRYGVPAPEVDFPTLQNGQKFTTGLSDQSILLDAVVVGRTDPSGNFYKEDIREITVLFNGLKKASLSGGEIQDQGYYYNFNLPTDLPSGEYKMEAVVVSLNGLTSRVKKEIVLQGANDPVVKLVKPTSGTPLTLGVAETIHYETEQNIARAYIEVNGKILWSHRLGFDGNSLPGDGDTITLTDGSGRPGVVYEFDSDGKAKEPLDGLSSGFEEVQIEKTQKNSEQTVSTGVISYNGTGDVHLVLEIDGEDSSGNDTYRVSNDGVYPFMNRMLPYKTVGWLFYFWVVKKPMSYRLHFPVQRKIH